MGVRGIDLFARAFERFTSSYVLIGGAACDILMREEEIEFRATKDLDIVLIADGDEAGFGAAFWKFVGDGGYKPYANRDGEVGYYRFLEPSDSAYPKMIELFARHPSFDLLNESVEIAPLPMSDEVSSLSAIILDDDYFRLVQDGAEVVEGLSVLRASHLIPLKMRAHIDLNDRKAAGEHVNSEDLKKHRKDVCRLLRIVSSRERVRLTPKMKDDAERFLRTLDDAGFNFGQLGLGMSKDDAVKTLRSMYSL